MSTCEQIIRALQGNEYDSVLQKLYAQDGTQERLERGRARALRVVKAFCGEFSPPADTDVALFSSPGRTEIGGNHTDHQHGRILCASVDLDMLACAAPRADAL